MVVVVGVVDQDRAVVEVGREDKVSVQDPVHHQLGLLLAVVVDVVGAVGGVALPVPEGREVAVQILNNNKTTTAS